MEHILSINETIENHLLSFPIKLDFGQCTMETENVAEIQKQTCKMYKFNFKLIINKLDLVPLLATH